MFGTDILHRNDFNFEDIIENKEIDLQADKEKFNQAVIWGTDWKTETVKYTSFFLTDDNSENSFRKKNNFDIKQSINGITKRQSDRLKGLRLLCHAEFED